MSSRSHTAPIVIALATLVLFWVPTVDWPLARDQGVWATVADVMHSGGMPYRDVFDVKPPMIHYFYALALGLFRDPLAVRIMDLALLAATLALALLLFPPRQRVILAFPLAAAYGLAHLFLFDYWLMAVPDNYIALPIVAAFACQKAWAARRRGLSRFFAGLFLGLAFWLKFTALVFAPLILWMDYLALRRSGVTSPRNLIRGWSMMALGFLVPATLILGHFTAKGALGDLLEVEFVYVPRYAGYQGGLSGDLRPLGFNVSFALREIGVFLNLLTPLVLPPSLFLLWTLLKRRSKETLLWLALLLAFLSVVAQKKFFLNHFGPLILWLSMLTAQCLATMARAGSVLCRRRFRLSAGLVAVPLTLLVLGGLTLMSSAFPNRRFMLELWLDSAADRETGERVLARHFGSYELGDYSHLANLEAADYLKGRTGPEETIFIWGFEPAVYFYSDRRPASRFIFNHILVDPLAPPQWRRELFETLSRSPPPLILVLGEDEQAFLHGTRGDSTATLRQTQPELWRWLQEEYRLEAQIEHFAIWERKGL